MYLNCVELKTNTLFHYSGRLDKGRQEIWWTSLKFNPLKFQYTHICAVYTRYTSGFSHKTFPPSSQTTTTTNMCRALSFKMDFRLDSRWLSSPNFRIHLHTQRSLCDKLQFLSRRRGKKWTLEREKKSLQYFFWYLREKKWDKRKVFFSVHHIFQSRGPARQSPVSFSTETDMTLKLSQDKKKGKKRPKEQNTRRNMSGY